MFFSGERERKSIVDMTLIVSLTEDCNSSEMVPIPGGRDIGTKLDRKLLLEGVLREEREDKEEGDVLTPTIGTPRARTNGVFCLGAGAAFFFLVERFLAMIKMGKRKKTKADEVRRKSGRRKHIREKREAPVGPCTKKMKVYLQIRK
jgi:hypothetical protein